MKKWPRPSTREPRVMRILRNVFGPLDALLLALSSLLKRSHLKKGDCETRSGENLLEPRADPTPRMIGGSAGKQPHIIPTLISTTL